MVVEPPRRGCRLCAANGTFSYAPHMSDSQREQVRALFDLVADDYATVEFFKPLGKALVDFAAVPPGSAALDLGAGRGAVTRPLAEAVGPSGLVVAADVSMAMTRALQRDVPPSAWCLQADAAAIPLRSATLDSVLSGFAIHILPDPAAALAEVIRVLRPGGLVAFSIPGPTGYPVIQGYADAIQEYSQRASPALWAMQPPPDLIEALYGAGFADVSEDAATVRVPIPDADTFLATDMSHGFRGWVDALSPADHAAFMSNALDALRDAAAGGNLTMDRGARLIRGTKPDPG